MGTDDSTYAHGIHVVHDGPREEAPPLVLVHGSGASGSSWGPVVPALARRHHVIRVDLPGHGQSPPAASYDVPGQAAVLAAALDELALSSVTVAGHSSGGCIATALAEQRPDLVGALALISSGPSPDALLPQPAVLRALIAPPLGPLMWRVRSDAMLRRGGDRGVQPPGGRPGRCGRRRAGHPLPHLQDGAAAQHRVHRRAECSRAARRTRRPGSRDLRHRRPPLGSGCGARLRRDTEHPRRATDRCRALPHARSARGNR
ncbi:alpha/beta fold hydrolase [Streptomyces sp. ms115]|uniref:alpha/beta fold hydrolase n=1 Tax=Streptomyces sp. ms115 TaxID=1827928 RepID=UPI00359C2991